VANMARREAPGAYQIGIYSVTREGAQWRAFATGPGTLGDGFAGAWRTLGAAHIALTGEAMREERRAKDSALLAAIDAGDKPPPGALATIDGRRFRKRPSGRGWRRIGPEA
jgi:hypothetical protein